MPPSGVPNTTEPSHGSDLVVPRQALVSFSGCEPYQTLEGGAVFFRAIPCPCSRQASRTLLCSSGTTPRSRPSTQPWHPHPCFGSRSQRLVFPRDLGFEFRESGRDIRPILTCRHIFHESALPPSRPTRQQHHSCGPPPHSREHHPCATSMWRRADHLPLHHTHAWHCRHR